MGKDEPLGLPVDELIEKAYGFAGFLRWYCFNNSYIIWFVVLFLFGV